MFRKSWFACMVEIGLRATSGKTMLENSNPVKPIAVSPTTQDLEEDSPIYEWQKRELDRSKAQYDAHPESLLSWEEVQANILAKHQ
jgi:Putative addiction module component